VKYAAKDLLDPSSSSRNLKSRKSGRPASEEDSDEDDDDESPPHKNGAVQASHGLIVKDLAYDNTYQSGLFYACRDLNLGSLQ